MTALSSAFNAKGASPSDEEVEAFLQAAQNNNHIIVTRLLDVYGRNIVHVKDDNGETALIKMAWNGQTKAVSLLLDNGADIEVQDNNGQTALIAAARRGYVATVTVLLDKGANMEAKTSGGNTSLIWAAWGGHVAVVSALLDRGANMEAKNNDGSTALVSAKEHGRTTVETLLDQWATQRPQKLAAEVATIHSGITQEVRVGKGLVLRAPATGRKP